MKRHETHVWTHVITRGVKVFEFTLHSPHTHILSLSVSQFLAFYHSSRTLFLTRVLFILILSASEQVICNQSPNKGRRQQGNVSEAPSDEMAATGVPIAGIMSLPLPTSLFCSVVLVAAVATYCHMTNFPRCPLPFPILHCLQKMV